MSATRETPRNGLLILILAMMSLSMAACGVQTTLPAPTTKPAPSDDSNLTPSPTLPPLFRTTSTSFPSTTAQPTAASTHTPTPQPTPRPIEGYWIQNTSDEGLCSDSPRFIGFDANYNRPYVGGEDATICYFGQFSLDRWTRDLPSPIFGFPSWISVDIPGMKRVAGGTAFSPYASPNPYVPSYLGVYGMPSFAGSDGRCILDDEGAWQCFTAAGGLPFDDIRGYGIVQDTNAEWFMSVDSVASRGQRPEDLFYAISELVGHAETRPTCLGVPRLEKEGVWVGTNGYGVIHIDPTEGHTTCYSVADGLPSDTIRDAQPCGEQCAWVATAGGVGHWDGARWKAYTKRDGLPSDNVRAISSAAYYWRDGVWAATAEGPAFLPEGSSRWQSFQHLPGEAEVNGVMYGDFSTRGQGLVRFVRAPVARGRTTLLAVEDGLPSNRITALGARGGDRGVLLVGTPRGAFEGDGHRWTQITDAAVNDLCSTAIATEEGLWTWRDETWQQVNDERILLVAEGGWYVTTGQVCRWESGDSSCPTKPDGGAIAGGQALGVVLEEGLVSVIDGQGQAWVCNMPDCDSEGFTTTRSFLELILPRRINDQVLAGNTRFYATERGIYDGDGLGDYKLAGGWPVSVRRMRLDEATGTLWIATNQGAFYRQGMDMHGQNWTYVAGLPSRDVTTVLPMPDGSVWLGTANAGLVYFK